MTNVDAFESVFRAAAKATFSYERPSLERILVVSDLDGAPASGFLESVRTLLAPLGDGVDYQHAHTDDFRTLEGLLELVADRSPDLVCTYRNLGSEAWRFPHSLGEPVDVLTQVASAPVLLLPHPEAGHARTGADAAIRRTMALSGHLAGDSELVDYAATLCGAGGTVVLAHVEDDAVFERYMDAISKIPELDTETARATLRDQLLKEPTDFAARCADGLAAAGIAVTVEPLITLGHRLRDLRAAIDDRSIDLVVLHTRDDDQLAMHGNAYSLAVEVRDIPLLLL